MFSALFKVVRIRSLRVKLAVSLVQHCTRLKPKQIVILLSLKWSYTTQAKNNVQKKRKMRQEEASLCSIVDCC